MLDFATANYGRNYGSIDVKIRLGDGTDTGFTTSATFAVGSNAYSVGVGDFNGDSKLDFPTANLGSSNASVLLNNNQLTASLTVAENDTAGIAVTPSTTTTTEVGGSSTLSMVLTSQPTADVTVNLVRDDRTTEGNLSTSTLNFTSANWNTGQSVTVIKVDDSVDDGDVAYNISANASSSDSNYNNKALARVSPINTDNETTGITVTPTNLSLSEGKNGVSYDILLTSAPPSPVTVSFDTGSQIDAISPITFDSTNWNVAQTVTAVATGDAVPESAHTGKITYTVTSADGNYDGLTITSVSESIADSDNNSPTAVTPIGNQTAKQDTTFSFAALHIRKMIKSLCRKGNPPPQPPSP